MDPKYVDTFLKLKNNQLKTKDILYLASSLKLDFNDLNTVKYICKDDFPDSIHLWSILNEYKLNWVFNENKNTESHKQKINPLEYMDLIKSRLEHSIYQIVEESLPKKPTFNIHTIEPTNGGIRVISKENLYRIAEQIRMKIMDKIQGYDELKKLNHSYKRNIDKLYGHGIDYTIVYDIHGRYTNLSNTLVYTLRLIITSSQNVYYRLII